MKKILVAILCCSLALSLYNCGGSGPSDKYVKTAELVNESLPMDIPGGLRLDKAEAASKDEFKYYYTFLQEPALSADDFVKASKGLMVATLKNQPEMKDFKDDNMTIIYVYNKPDGSLYTEIKITADEYK